MAPPRVRFSCCSAVAVIEMRCRGDCVGRRGFAKRGFLSLLGRKKMGYCPSVMPKGTRQVLFGPETYGTCGERECLCGEGACSRWAAQRPQPRHRDLSGGLRSAFRLLRSQREQAPSPQERFGGVARRSMHAVGATPDVYILERECLCGEVRHNGLIPPRHRPGNRRSVATSPRGWSTSGNARNRRLAPTGRLRPGGATGRTARHSARRT